MKVSEEAGDGPHTNFSYFGRDYSANDNTMEETVLSWRRSVLSGTPSRYIL